MSLFRIGSRPPPSFEDPIAVLELCHRRIEERLATLARAAAALDHPETPAALAEIVRHFEMAVPRHHADEEYSLFPRLAGNAAADALLEQLADEHRVMSAIELALRTAIAQLGEKPEVAEELTAHAAALRDAYRDHLAREERELFPMARALAPAELRAIGIEMRLRRGGSEP